MKHLANGVVRTEAGLQFILKFISLKPKQKILVCAIVTEFIQSLTNQLKSQLTIFTNIGYLLCGSYRDQIKISPTDEFDFNVIVELPGAAFITDDMFPGLVRINVNECVKSEENKHILHGMTDGNGYLKVRAFLGFFESLIAKTRINEHSPTIRGHSLSIKVTKSGPAYKLNIAVKDCPSESPLENFKFSIDLVPALKCSNQVSSDPIDTCIAIPKPINGTGNSDHTFFVPSFPLKESAILKDKNNLKNPLRLFKKLRDRNNIGNLKSYFIKTAFLWMTKYSNNKFWDRPCEDILLDAMETMKIYLEKRKLPFYWHRRYNMLGKLSSTQIDSMRVQIESIIKKFKKGRNTIEIVKLFLTQAEQQQLAKRGMQTFQ